MSKELYGNLSDVPAAERCQLESCVTVFPGADCLTGSLFTCRYEHTHYDDGSGLRDVEATASTLTEAHEQARDACIQYTLYDSLSELPPTEACLTQGCSAY